MDKLSEIMAAKRREIEPIIRPIRDSELSNLGERMKSGPSFVEALSSPDELSVIAEIKREVSLRGRNCHRSIRRGTGTRIYKCQCGLLICVNG